jgi:hypothetical protein
MHYDQTHLFLPNRAFFSIHRPVFGRVTARSGNQRNVVLFLVFCFLISGTLETHGETAKDYDLKAVFLFNFAQFVDWPSQAFPNANSPIVIGILGDDPFGKSLDEVVRNEKVGDRKLVVKRFRRIEETDFCHILFVNESKTEKLDEILTSVKGKPILTVGETEGFAFRGGMIRFFNDQNKIRLRINTEAAEACNLMISSKLLKAAQGSGKTAPQ